MIRTSFTPEPDPDNSAAATWQPQLFGSGAQSTLRQSALFDELHEWSKERAKAKRLHAKRIEEEGLFQ